MDNARYNNKIVNPLPALLYSLFLSICSPYLDVVLPPKSALHLRLSPPSTIITCGDINLRKFPSSELQNEEESHSKNFCHTVIYAVNSVSHLCWLFDYFFAGGKQDYMVLTILNSLRSLNAEIQFQFVFLQLSEIGSLNLHTKQNVQPS